MCIGIHAHHLPAAYMDMLRDGGGPTFGAAHDEGTLRKMIEGQEEAGIRCQVISFAAFGSAPLPHGEAAATEAVRCLDELDFAAMHFGCSALGHSLDSPAFADMWTELDRREAIIYIHPGGILCGTEPGLAGMDDAGIAVTIGSAAERAAAALRLAALCRTHRRLRVVIGLLGGALPFLLGRVVWLGERFKGKSLLGAESPDGSLVAELRRFSDDTSLLPDPKTIGFARAAFGLDRLLYGGLSEDEFAEILVENPRRLFGERLAGRPVSQITHRSQVSGDTTWLLLQ